ncbi:MAG: magnesium chelatase domain-containing protein, partial [Candidatus Puniceispirillaceae bacterium]
FLNVAGGLRIAEPAADLAVAAALVSSVSAKPLPARAVFFGEVALSAELRQVPQAETRLKEAAKLGFEQGFMPKFSKKIRPPSGISTTQPDNLSDFIDLLSGRRA